MAYNARMAEHGGETFGQALKRALRAARINQAELSRRLVIDPGQVSRWATDKAMPHEDTVARIEEELGADLSASFSASVPAHELYVSAPVTGLGRRGLAAHHDAVATVVETTRTHVNSIYWPGNGVRNTSDLIAADIATERNMRALQHSTALLFLQFAEVVRPSGAFVELGIALGRRMKTTLILGADLHQPYMLDGFGGVAASVSFLPKARIYTVNSVDEACDLIEHNGRELLGLA